MEAVSFLTVEEAAQKLRVSPDTIRRFLRDKKVHGVRVGGQWRIPTNALQAVFGLFEFGETAEAEAFFDRHKNFYPAFERLIALVNTCFARPLPKPDYGPEYILFGLGESCREDFLEILFLAVNGHGCGASKLLRGLYERAVALAYMVKEPAKAKRFRDFAVIQEHKALKDALKVMTEQEWDVAMRAGRTAAEIRSRFEAVKADFQQTDCRKCRTKRLAITWDLDIASMVSKVGAPYDVYYLGAYTTPNLELHATLASAMREDNKDKDARRARRLNQADFALFCSAMLLVEVVRSENELLQLNLGDELQATEDAVARLWKAAIDAKISSASTAVPRRDTDALVMRGAEEVRP
jgi:excisionase family DNA binding protein